MLDEAAVTNRAQRTSLVDLLDQIVWTEVMRLLEDPALIEQELEELDRWLAVARAADRTKQREQTMQRELVRVGKGIERLLTAYQEELLSLEQLRERMPALRQRGLAAGTPRVDATILPPLANPRGRYNARAGSRCVTICT